MRAIRCQHMYNNYLLVYMSRTRHVQYICVPTNTGNMYSTRCPFSFRTTVVLMNDMPIPTLMRKG